MFQKTSPFTFSWQGLAIAAVLGLLTGVCAAPWLSHTILGFGLLLSFGFILCRLREVGWALLVFSLGVLWSYGYVLRAVGQAIPADVEMQETELHARLVDLPKAVPRGWQFDVRADEWPGKIRLSYYLPEGSALSLDDIKPRVSCRYTLRVRLKRPAGFQNFDLFQYQDWLYASGYAATGTVRSAGGCEAARAVGWLSWRETLAANIAMVPASERSVATLLALLLGSYALLQRPEWELLRESGTIHLLSVSGLHIALVAGLAFRLAKALVSVSPWLLRRWPAACWASVVSLLLAILYALLSGFAVATQRSLYMVVVMVLQVICYARYRFWFSTVLSLLVVLLANPLSLYLSGFWFSFIATAILLFCAWGQPTARGICGRVVTPAVRSQLAVFLVMMPVLLYVYGQTPLVALPVNAVAVPWVSFVSLPLAFIGLLLYPLSPAWFTAFLQASAWTLDRYWEFVAWSAALGDSWQLQVPAVHWPAMLLACAGAGLLFLPRAVPMRVAACFLVLPLFWPPREPLAAGDVVLHVLDVGQGLAVMVRTAGHALLYDTGDARPDGFDSGRDIVLPAARAAGISRFDMLVVSHPDRDHAGGMPAVLADMPVGHLLSGVPEVLHSQRPFLPCRAGMHWRWDDVDFRILHPGEALASRSNNRSCVLRIESHGRVFLLPGDIELAAEKELLARYAAASPSLLDSFVLLAPHHGSKTSSSSVFLNATGPAMIVASAGLHNRFHHPAGVVTARYEQLGIPWFSTAERGAVRFLSEANGVAMAFAACQDRRLWRQPGFCASSAARPSSGEPISAE